MTTAALRKTALDEIVEERVAQKRAIVDAERRHLEEIQASREEAERRAALLAVATENLRAALADAEVVWKQFLGALREASTAHTQARIAGYSVSHQEMLRQISRIVSAGLGELSKSPSIFGSMRIHVVNPHDSAASWVEWIMPTKNESKEAEDE